MSRSLDYYQILQVKFGAQKADITASYRRLCKLYHPDVNRNPGTEEIMKQINAAYAFLSDDKKREAYNRKYSASRGVSYKAPAESSQAAGPAAARSSVNRQGRAQGMSESEKKARAQKEEEDRKAFLVMQEYYSCLLIHNYERAYELLSELDKQYITMKTFTEWRDFINRQLIMREFTIKCSESVQSQNLREGLNSPVKKHYIDTVVKNLLNQATENQYAAKYTVQENGSWRILLGYRDLGDIAAFFNRLSLDREKSEMEKHWEQYCEDNCRRLDILSLNGLLKEAESEIYRYRRYKQALTLACFALKHQEDVSSEKSLSDILEAASKTINDSVREVDIPAYIGNGMFAILYVEMKKRQANSAVKRLRERLIKSILQETNHKVDIETMILQYTGGAVKAYIDSFCEKFLK